MKKLFLFLLLSFIGKAAALETPDESMLLVEKAYVRATIPGTSHSSSYMEIENKGKSTITLLGASSKASPRIEIHQHTMVDGMMRMRKINSIDIKPNERVKLQPSGLHLMLFDVEKPLKAQQSIELTLNFSNNVSVTIPTSVYSPAQERKAQKMMPNTHEHHH